MSVCARADALLRAQTSDVWPALRTNRASRVFWQVNGAGAVGATAEFAGTLMAMDAVAMGNGTLVNGRALARNGALTLDNNQFYSAPRAVAIAGGATAITTDTTPTISGTTDVEAPGVVTVTINGQTLTATPAGGAWSVTSAILANDVYPVTASVIDRAGNPGGAQQQLTVDTVLPLVAIDGGPSATTNDPTVTIAGGANALTDDAPPQLSGTAAVAAGTTVTVTLANETLTGLVDGDGGWSVTAATLSNGPHRIVVSVSDAAGNAASFTQTLTVDTVSPFIAITGGANRDDQRPQPDDRRDHRRRAGHDRHGVDRQSDDDDARAGQRHMECDTEPRR